MRIQGILKGYNEPEQREGAWIVYGIDGNPHPLFLSNDELIARRYQERVSYFTWIKFWKFGDEFGTE